uniref:Cytochrome c oxidase subunit 8 n=1 Tax=Rattus norvegicus TaxID=10116 RepID=A0A8I5ZVZ8_RAT
MSVLTLLLLLQLQLLSLTGSAHLKPPQEQLRVLDITIGLTSCFMRCLQSAGWVLSHLEGYENPDSSV